MRAFLALALASVFLLPITVGTEEPVTAYDEEIMQCRGHLYRDGVPSPWPCWFHARANWTVEACDAASCTVRVDVNDTFGAVQPGTIYMESTFWGGTSGSVCLGPQAVSDQLKDVVPCHRVCQTLKVGWTAHCKGTTTATLELEPGYCMGVWVAHHFQYNQYVPVVWSGDGVMMFTFLCRDDEGTPRFTVSPRSPR